MYDMTAAEHRFLAPSRLAYSVPKPVFRRILTRWLARTKVYPKVSRLAAWSENYKRYSSLVVSAVISLLC